MPDAMMYNEDNYVLLSPSMEQEFMTLPQLQAKLRELLAKIQDDLPRDLQDITSVDAQVDRLVKTDCELEVVDEGTWQWYVVRLEKPGS